MEATGSSETLVPNHQTTQQCIPEECNLKTVKKEFHSHYHRLFLLNAVLNGSKSCVLV
jgi:hypothetical protein